MYSFCACYHLWLEYFGTSWYFAVLGMQIQMPSFSFFLFESQRLFLVNEL